MKNQIIMNVIIPTRERADTLYWTLKTCVDQDYKLLNIFVCDNCSNDNTREVVESFADNRITYINPGRRLSMTQNWEFALSHITEGYVTILGDDDGLLPNAIADVSKIIELENVSAFSWLKSDYCWPDHIHPELRNHLSIPLENRLIVMPARKVARDVSLFLLSYSRTPTLYNSFVDYKVISAIRDKSGAVLRSAAPDVYSGISVLSEMDTYLFSLRPYSVNGASSHSNGTSTRSTQNKDAANKYQIELVSEESEQLGIVRGSIYSIVAESIYQANEHCYGGKLLVSKRVVLFYILAEMAMKGEQGFNNSLGDIKLFAKRHKLGIFFHICMFFIKPKFLEKSNKVGVGLSRPGVLGINAEKFNLMNVYDASKFVYLAIDKQDVLNRTKYSLWKRLLLLLLNRFPYLHRNVSF